MNNRRILVVDDNITIHDDFRKILMPGSAAASALDQAEAAVFGDRELRGQPGFDVETALQGAEAVEQVQRAQEEGRPYAMAFVDVRMPPGIDGIETTRRIWEIDSDMQIVICTAFSEYSWNEMLDKLGTSDQLLILKKPFDNIEVLQMATSLTAKWMLSQERKNRLAELEAKVRERTAALEGEIRERKQAEDALYNSQEQALRQERLAVVGQLSAGMAHEFNNLLTVVQGHTSLLLRDRSLGAKIGESLQAIAESSERGANLIRQMLAFSRKQVMQPQLLDLGKLVESLRQILAGVLGETISISYVFAEKMRMVKVDPNLIQQVLINLALNARDAMTEGGTVRIETASASLNEGDGVPFPDGKTREFVCLEFSDTGCGMDRATRQRIFEPFFTTKPAGKGTGLGLASVYGIVKQHQGWINVTSEPGNGTTFKIYLPARHEASTVPVAPKEEVPEIRGGRETILVVEDDNHLRQLVGIVLRRYGYRVIEAESGAKALAFSQADLLEVDLLLTDMVMPGGISGSVLAQQLRASNPTLRVIKSSGYSEEIARRRKLAPFEAFLPKPYPPMALVRAIRELLDQPAQVSVS